jgi:hypothetical protein
MAVADDPAWPEYSKALDKVIRASDILKELWKLYRVALSGLAIVPIFAGRRHVPGAELVAIEERQRI